MNKEKIEKAELPLTRNLCNILYCEKCGKEISMYALSI
jgi:hypothetical protein